MIKTDADGLAAVLAKALSEYDQDVTDQVKEIVKKHASQLVTAIRAASPTRTGVYKKSWTKKTAFESDKDIRIQVYNKDRGNLTHLLEFGHAKRGGGRVDAKPHIYKAEKDAAAEMQKDIEAVVKG